MTIGLKHLGRTRAGASVLIAASIAAVLFIAYPSSADPPRVREPIAAIEISAKPITAFDPRDSRTRFGALEFRGGLELTSPNRDFGGLSAIHVAPDGARFLAVSDHGRWLRGRIVYEDKRPVRIVDAEIAPILGPDGRPLGARGWHDTESIAEDGGRVYVGIERANRILRFDYARDGLSARGQPIAVPAEIGKLPNNKGLEALVFVPRGHPLSGTLIAIAESGDENGLVAGFLIGGASPGAFSIRRSDDFDVTGAALAGRDLLVLERRFTMLRGVAMRIRRIALASVKPGAIVDGAVLIEADMGFQIDNMEGISVHRAGGDTVLTLVSDDNFSPIQRTLLLQFILKD